MSSRLLLANKFNPMTWGSMETRQLDDGVFSP